MSNNIYCVPDEKKSLKQAYIVFIYVSLGEEGKKDKITANACLRQNEFMVTYIHGSGYVSEYINLFRI